MAIEKKSLTGKKVVSKKNATKAAHPAAKLATAKPYMPFTTAKPYMPFTTAKPLIKP